METNDIAWDSGEWLNPPAVITKHHSALVVTAAEGTDAWRTTSYGFVRDSAHGLLSDWPAGTAMEVDFVAEFDSQFDQAGILLRGSPSQWIKAGVEFADGMPHLGAVVTAGASDWSAAPVPGWAGRTVTVRASRSGDAITIRARLDGGEFQLVRVAPMDPAAPLRAGPYCCAPSRAGLDVKFTGWRLTPADGALH